jgi:hypothetical protein
MELEVIIPRAAFQPPLFPEKGDLKMMNPFYIRLVECDYCQGHIDGKIAYLGGRPVHPECLEERNRIAAKIAAEETKSS